MSFMRPKVPSAEEMARAQDKIQMERDARQVIIDKETAQSDAANNLSKALKRKRGRGTLITRRGGGSYMGIKDEALGPSTKRTLLGKIYG